jgi:hypothetical protein
MEVEMVVVAEDVVDVVVEVVVVASEAKVVIIAEEVVDGAEELGGCESSVIVDKLLGRVSSKKVVPSLAAVLIVCGAATEVVNSTSFVT